MNVQSIVVMVLICGFVWGGFALLILRAIRSERGKRDAG